MRALTIFPDRWLEYEPPGLCHTGLEALFAAIGLGGAGAAGAGTATAFSALAGAGETALLSSAGLETGLAAGLPAVGAAASAAPWAAATGGGLSLSTLGQAAGVGGTLLQAKAGMDNADYQAAVARAEAAALKQKANEDAAAAERVQITRNRQTDLALSRARAVGAASGTQATSPDIVNTEGQIAQQGGYNALSALYEGRARARSDEYQANIDLFKAQRIDAGAFPTFAGTLLSGLGSFADRKLQRNYLLNQSY